MLSRRHFLTRLALGATVLGVMRLPVARAAELPHLNPDDPVAKALAYTEQAATVDAKAEVKFKSGSRCANCNFFQTAQAAGGYAPCTIFPGRSVNQGGWCRAWAPKP
jgi:hypothetical protein